MLCEKWQFLIGCVVSIAVPAFAASVAPAAAAPFPFVMPWNDSSKTDVDVSFLNAAPAGDHGFIRVQDGRFVEGDTGRRIRFLGVVFAGADNFPSHADAAAVAARLAKYGFNLVRLHWMDNIYSDTIWDKSYRDHRHIDPARLERLDYLIAQLKKNGIYVDINLKVGRQFSPDDGLPESFAQIPVSVQKRLDFFDRRLIELQKEYARDLLTHVNPYTHRAYVSEPAVLSVELNNENSMVTLLARPIDMDLSNLPAPFDTELTQLWNDWLKRQYATTDKLAAAWTAPLPPGESLEASSVAIPPHPAGPQSHDWIEFLADVEFRYASEMRAYLKDDLGLHALLIDSQPQFGGLMGIYRERAMDYIDEHAYWDHPTLPPGNWKSGTIKNVSSVTGLPLGFLNTDSDIGPLSKSRVAGMPYSISEFNHPAPNEYQAECVPIIASGAAFQDWDTIVLHAYGPYGADAHRDFVDDFFDIGDNPAKMAFLPSAALMFRAGYIAPASRIALLPMPEKFSAIPVVGTPGMLTVQSYWRERMPQTPDFTRTRIAMSFGQYTDRPAPDAGSAQLEHHDSDPSRAYYTASAPRAKAVIGFVGGQTVALPGATFMFESAVNNYAVLTMTSTDGKSIALSSHVLLTVLSRVENTDQVWAPDRTRLLDWGKAPVLVDVPVVAVSIDADGPRVVTVLDYTGARKRVIASTYENGKVRFTVDPSYEAVWYLLTPPGR